MKKRIVILLLVVLAAMMVFGACANGGAQQTPDQPAGEALLGEDAPSETASAQEDVPEIYEGTGILIEDLAGNTAEIESVEKIVSLTPSGTEIVYSLGAGDKIVGRDSMSGYPAEAEAVEVVGDFNGPDIEKIAALEPDVILAGTNSLQADAVAKLKELGLTVVSVEAQSFDEIFGSITIIGEIVGKSMEAQELNDRIAEAMPTASDNVPAEDRKTVYYAMSYGDMGNWTSGPDSFVNTVIEAAGGRCVTEDADYAWIEYSVEDLAAKNPDVVLLASDAGTIEELAKTQGYEGLDAVKNGKVFSVDADVMSRPGPRIIDAIEMVRDILGEA